MRDYSKISPRFWIGETGRKLREAGANVQVVAMYLLTSPHANMLGLYYLPVGSLWHETGLTAPKARAALAKAKAIGFCDYDEEAEVVWVHEMARFQVGERLEPADKRCRGIQKEYLALSDNRFLDAFFDKYAPRFHLTTRREVGHQEAKALESPIEAPSKPLLTGNKPLRSQEQEQEQEHKQEQEQEGKIPLADARGVAGDAEPPATPGEISSIPNCPHEQLVALYHEMLPTCPRILKWNNERRGYLRARWKEEAKPNGVTRGYATVDDGLTWWRKFFGYVADSKFLTGMASGRDGKGPFVADLEWLVRPNNFAKIIEGKYHDAAA